MGAPKAVVIEQDLGTEEGCRAAVEDAIKHFKTCEYSSHQLPPRRSLVSILSSCPAKICLRAMRLRHACFTTGIGCQSKERSVCTVNPLTFVYILVLKEAASSGCTTHHSWYKAGVVA
jgi:hypothetical protein